MVSLGPKRMLKTQIFGINANFPMKKRFWPIFSRFLECDKPQALKCKGPRGFPAFTVQVNRLLLGPKVSLQTNFSSLSCFHGDKRFWPVFRCTIESDKPQETIYTGPQATLTITVEVMRSLL